MWLNQPGGDTGYMYTGRPGAGNRVNQRASPTGQIRAGIYVLDSHSPPVNLSQLEFIRQRVMIFDRSAAFLDRSHRFV